MTLTHAKQIRNNAPTGLTSTNQQSLNEEIAAKLASLITVATGSQPHISFDQNTLELSVSPLLMTNVTVDESSADIAAAVTANYSVGDELQEGDTLIITTSGEAYIHNGGTAGDASDFTKIETPGVSDSAIRSLLSSGNTAIDYNPATGVFSLTLDPDTDNLATITANGLFVDKKASTSTIEDAAGNFNATNVEDALTELAESRAKEDYIGITSPVVAASTDATVTVPAIKADTTPKVFINGENVQEFVVSASGTSLVVNVPYILDASDTIGVYYIAA